MSNAVINVIPGPITSSSASEGKQSDLSSQVISLLPYTLDFFFFFQLDYLLSWNGAEAARSF